jgi:hypothetical protein
MVPHIARRSQTKDRGSQKTAAELEQRSQGILERRGPFSFNISLETLSLIRVAMQVLRERGSSRDAGEKQTTRSFDNKDKRRSVLNREDAYCKRIRQQAQVRWSLASRYSRGILAACFLLLFLNLFVGTWDFLFRHHPDVPRPAGSEQTLAVVINTYKRPQQLRDAVQHYAETCGRQFAVDQVFIVWAEKGVTPPEPSSFFLEDKTLRKRDNRSTVQVVPVEKNSLNGRFLPIAGMKSKAVFMVDDDIRVDCPSLLQGFNAWRANPDSMVGYYPRLATPRQAPSTGNTDEYTYHSWPEVFWGQRMNFILTKASFLHKRYLELYSSDGHPQAIKDYIDKYFNCEDVAMSLLVANVTKAESSSSRAAKPIYVEASVSDMGLFNGISTGPGHMNRRSECLTDLTRIYREHGWAPPLNEVFGLKETSWVQHSPGFWWQHRPSNFFEWFALENFFQ